MPDRSGTSRGPFLLAVALLVCCAGHALVLTFGAAGAVAALGAVTGDRFVVAAGVVGITLAGTAVIIRVRRPAARGARHRTNHERCRS